MLMRSSVFSAAALVTFFFAVAHAQEVKADPAPADASHECETNKYSIDEMMRKLVNVPLENWSVDGIGNLGSHKVGLMIDNVQKRINTRMADQQERILADVRNIRAGKGNMTWETLKTSTHYSFHGVIKQLEADAVTIETAKSGLNDAHVTFIKDAVAKLQAIPTRTVQCDMNLSNP